MMAGLSAREQEGCRRLLALLDTDDLFSVAETVTNRLIHVFSKEGEWRTTDPSMQCVLIRHL